MLCMECGAEMRWTEDDFEEEYRVERFAVSGVAHWACGTCGNYQVDGVGCDAVSRSLATQYARAHGVPTPWELRELRRSLGMTQRGFEAAMGVSSPTRSRWESVAMIPSGSAAALMRCTGRTRSLPARPWRARRCRPRAVPFHGTAGCFRPGVAG